MNLKKESFLIFETGGEGVYTNNIYQSRWLMSIINKYAQSLFAQRGMHPDDGDILLFYEVVPCHMREKSFKESANRFCYKQNERKMIQHASMSFVFY